jgi:hypothetical protein
MSYKLKSAIALLIGIAAFALWPASNACAASLKLSVVPGEATANSVYTFKAVWTDTENKYWPTPINGSGNSPEPGIVTLYWETTSNYITSAMPMWLIKGIPMYYWDGDPASGATYYVSVSCGLNLSNPYQNPNSFTYLPNLTSDTKLDMDSWVPDWSLNNILWDPHGYPLWWASNLEAMGNGYARTVEVKARAWGKDLEDEDVVWSEVASVTINDSRVNYQAGPDGSLEKEMIDYGGNQGDRDWLSAGPPGASDIDPLTVEPSSDSSGIYGDDGSASHEYVFRVKYRNRENRPPMPWWHTANYDPTDFLQVPDWGVALYLDVLGIGDYRLIPMRPEAGGSTKNDYTSLTWNGDGQVFIARLLPNDGMANPLLFEYDGLYFPSLSCWAYNALPVGAFNYFFACSDDWLRFTMYEGIVGYDSSKDFPRQASFLLENQPDAYEWGVEPNPLYTWNVPTGYNNVERLQRLSRVCSPIDWSKVPFDATDDLWSTIPWGRDGEASDAPDYTTIPFYANNNPLDPTNERKVTGITSEDTSYYNIDRAAHRRYSTDDRYAFDSTIFVDRPVFVPGKFDSTYQYVASEHPVVNGALTVPVYDDVNVSYRDTSKYGGGRYYGTLLFGTDRTFKRAMNPQLAGTYLPDADVRTVDARRAETAGATTSTLCTFRIMYKSQDGQGPSYVRVMIGNTSSRGSLTSDDYQYLTMSVENPLGGLDYTKGVWYIAQKTFTTPGPYHYFFEASDGHQTIIWPRRPDHYEYSGQIWDDWWVPTLSTPDDYMIDDPDNEGQRIPNPDYDNNDFVPGPFINSTPQLTDWSVTPTSGKQGQNFKFRVLYKDADGQRPYSTKLIIETNSSGNQRVCQMLPETTLDTSQNNSARYKSGVYYYFNTATTQDLVLEKGTRRYKFQFSDDWGRQVELNDRISGETYTTGWISGPTIKANSAPTLYDGSIESVDGTSNAASLWTFSATYADQDNDAPSIKKVYIGLLQPDGKTILWDEGHDMLQSDTNDTTYNDGVMFYYQTRLSGIENKDYETAKQYYYAFLFKDSYQWATYKSSSVAETRSNAASCITSETLKSLGGNRYKFQPVIVQQASVNAAVGGVLKEVTPSDPNDILELYGVYLTEDLDSSTVNNTNYYSAGSSPYVTGDETVYLNTQLPTGTTRVWLKYQGQSPIVGPLPNISDITDSSVIADAQVFDNSTLVLVDDLKSGWQATDDERYSIMPGVALDSAGNVSKKYVVPEDASIIASVEGVYTSIGLVDDPSENYYDPSTVAYDTMTGTVDPSAVYNSSSRTGITVLPASPDLIREVVGVYTEAEMTDALGNSGIDTKGRIMLDEDDAQTLGNTVYIRYIRTMFNTGDSIIWLTDELPTAGQRVFIKYSDTRFTHTVDGFAQKYDNTSGNWTQGTTHFSLSANANLKVDTDDPTSGVLGAWVKSDTSRSYFDPFRAASVNDSYYYTDTLHLPLTYEVPSGTDEMWARYYQNGDYTIDRWDRIVQFKEAPSGAVTSTYMFGSRMPMTVGANTAPTLSEGSVSPITSESTTQFVYKVKYTDTDGPNGQAPAYVKVYIDGNAQLMTQVSAGTPAYREGAYYTYATSNLGPKGHKYRFEASDGADVAIYDWYTANDEDRPGSTDDNTLAYIDLDGPYVNSLPQLLDGTASPTGTIAADDTVTFTVTYKDTDSDPPYFFDKTKDVDSSNNPVGESVSGSPRIWLDTTDTDTLTLGKVVSLSADPLMPDKMRTIVVTDSSGNNPNWTTNQYAGKLMQITSGNLFYRVYLVQSNTANTLTVATDNLGTSGDNLTAGSTFTINGLLMIRKDTNDYSVGTLYELTVPKLAVGSHTYRFTARSRVTKPQWLLDIEKTFQPYSEKVLYPADAAATGPTVESKAPTGNVAPVLNNTYETSLYKGPIVNVVTVESTSTVNLDTSRLGNWTTTNAENIREVLGVYLTDPTTGSPTNYYDTTQTFDPTASTIIALSPSLSAMPSTWVQTGTVSALDEVVPESIDTIGTLVGVYDNAELSGTNYLLPENAGDEVVSAIGTSTIKLARSLPTGTETVYILCEPIMYLKYYEKSSSTTKFLAGEPITFAIKYSDADNDPPTYHDSVQGYLKVVFGDGTNATQLLPATQTSGSYDYKAPVQFKVTVTNCPEGTVKYHFEGSDGYDPDHKVRWPASTDYELMVNYKPTLTNASMEPASGQPGSTFKFYVTYKDLDGSATGAPTPVVNARLTNISTDDEYVVPLAAKSTTPVYATGADFTGSKAGLPAGTYSVVFEANDGYQDAVSVTYQNLVVRDTNNAPQITGYDVTPAAGKISKTFVYSATYVDADNDPPVFISGSTRTEGLTLLIDKGMSSEQTLKMTRTTTGTPDYTAGVVYQASILGKNLGTGEHTYTVKASDGTDDASTPAVKNGPVLLQPFITNLRAVSSTADDPDSAEGITTASVGDNVLIVGRIKFPINSVTDVPTNGSIEDVAVKVTKPDGTQLALVGKVTMLMESDNVTVSNDGTNWIAKLSVGSYPSGADTALVTGENLTLCASGIWKIGVAWAGDTNWDKVETDEGSDGVNDGANITVGGPMRTVAVRDASKPDDVISSEPVVDMICPPMKIGSGEAGTLFGYTRANLMQIVRWDPESKDYYWYGLSGTFPTLQSGQAVWVKPKSSYPTESISMADTQSGMLALGNPDVGLDYTKKYRLVRVFSEAYDTQINSKTGLTEYAPCTIQLKAGWNQFGNIFFNWKRDGAGDIITPREDVGIPISEVKVKYLDVEKTLDAAASAGWIRNYAWRWDAANYEYALVNATMSDAERVLKAWYGYWIKALVNCKLIINPNTSYNGVSSSVAAASVTVKSEQVIKAMQSDYLEMPPLPE